MVAYKAGRRLGREWIYGSAEKQKIKGRRNGAQVLSLVAKRRGQPGTHRRD